MSKKVDENKMKLDWRCVTVTNVGVNNKDESTSNKKIVNITYQFMDPYDDDDNVVVEYPLRITPTSPLTKIVEILMDINIDFTENGPCKIDLSKLINKCAYFLFGDNGEKYLIKDIVSFSIANKDTKIIDKLLLEKPRFHCAPGCYPDICRTCPAGNAKKSRKYSELLAALEAKETQEQKHRDLMVSVEKK